MPRGPMLEGIDLECQRGSRLLFAALSFRVEPSRCLHVAGENGAGKTSLLRILCRRLGSTRGEVRAALQELGLAGLEDRPRARCRKACAAALRSCGGIPTGAV